MSWGSVLKFTYDVKGGLYSHKAQVLCAEKYFIWLPESKQMACHPVHLAPKWKEGPYVCYCYNGPRMIIWILTYGRNCGIRKNNKL